MNYQISDHIDDEVIKSLVPGHAVAAQMLRNLDQDQRQSTHVLDRGVRTIRYAHSILHRSLAKAVLYGLVPTNTAHGASLPRYQHQEMRVLDADQIGRLLAAASGNRLEALFHLAAVTGMRQGELFGLKWTDVLWSTGLLHVQRQVQRVPRQGWSFFEPKTRAGRRRVPIGAGAMDALRRQKERQALERAVAGKRWQEHGLIFSTGVGTPMDAHNLRKDFLAVLREAGLPEVRFHDLRHSAANLMLNHGVLFLVVSKILGHTNPSITLNTYGHLYTGSVGAAGQLMDGLVTPLRVSFSSDTQVEMPSCLRDGNSLHSDDL
jgi:integrase